MSKKIVRLFCLGMGVWLLCGSSPVRAQKVSLHIKGTTDDMATEKAVVWVEGIWMDVLRKRFKGSVQALSEIDPEQSQALQRANRAFKVGKKAFEELNPDLAFRKFKLSVKLYTQAGAYLNVLTPLCKSLLYIGVSHLLNGKQVEGKTAFLEAVQYCPDLTMAGITNENDKIQIFNKAKEESKKRAKGTITVKASVQASVFVNGRFRGISPAKISLPIGKHIISVRRSGYLRWGKQITVAQGQSKTYNAPMRQMASYNNWYTLGNNASDHVKAATKVDGQVQAYGKLMQTKLLAVAQVQRIKDKVWIVASVYDLSQNKQRAAGGAIVAWPGGEKKVRELLNRLLFGENAALGGWSAKKIPIRRPTPTPGGSNVGLIVGLSVAGAALIAGGVVLAVLFLTPESCDQGSCVKITLTP